MRHRCVSLLSVLAGVLLLAGCPGCQRDSFDLDAATVDVYHTRVVQSPTAAPAVSQRVRSGWGPAASQPGATQPDALGERVPSRIVKLTLEDAFHRALANSLDIRIESYSPGIAAADILAAEAAFDAVFFSNFQYSKLDQPVNSTLTSTGGQSDDRKLESGLRKRLSSGGEMTAKYTVDRNSSNQQFLRFPTNYNNDLTLEFRQPLLQNFGADVARAEIHIARNRRDISLFTFRRQVIDTLSRVEQGYWNLHLARQQLAIQQWLLAETQETERFVRARLELDALPAQLSQAKAAVASERATVIRLAANVRDAEDLLKNLLNDPELPLDEDIAILPVDEPVTERMPVNPEQELWAGLEHRGELQEARLNISNAVIGRGLARNTERPKLDLFFQWNINGMRENFPHANEELFSGDRQDYVVGLSFEFPIGNRAAKAQIRKTQLLLDQAVAAYHNAAADVMLQIQAALRDMQTSYDEILANREAVLSAEENVRTTMERRERLNFEYVDLELRTKQLLAERRRSLLSNIVNYNNAVVRLEQAKGTLLRYDRVELTPEKQ